MSDTRELTRPSKKVQPVRSKVTHPELYHALCDLSARLQFLHSAIPSSAPKDIGLQIAGAFKFLQMAQQELLEQDAQTKRYFDRQLPWATLVIEEAKKKGFHGFGGNCFATAIAINHVLFGAKLSYFIAANEALRDAGRTIGHATVYYKDVEGVRHHLDADAQVKLDVDVESWGMLDHEDLDYQEIAEGLGIEWTEEAANQVAMVEITESDLRALTNEAEIQSQIALLEEASRHVDFAAGVELEATA